MFGEGALDLVVVTGFVGHVELWWDGPGMKRFLSSCAEFARVLVYDKREQGLSDRLGTPPTLEESMDDLRAVMDAAGFERAAVAGISEGGPMVALFAATHPGRVSHLVLYGTFAKMLNTDGHDPGLPVESLDGLAEYFEEEWGGPVGLHMWAPSGAEDPEAAEWWGRLLRQGTSPRGINNLLSLYREIDVRPVLPTIAVPTLVVHREFDMVVPEPQGRYMADHIPGAVYKLLPGTDHVPIFDDGRDIVEVVGEFLTGERQVPEPERVLSTVLFTDIVGSTQQAAAMGDARWRSLLERHDAIVHRQIDRHRGRAIKSLGDGHLATFDGPARGVRCAQEIARAVDSLGVRVRAGLHTGECELIGDDVGGMAVNIGARVSARAGPGEVLVSSTVKDLVVGSGIEFEERGSGELKGVPGEWRLFAAL